jgi:branched-chain amino acid transport system ATP-binding protein
MLEMNDLVVSYHGVDALKGVSLHVREGETVALLGPNGAGKSTLLNTVAGILKPRLGSITFEGLNIAGLHPELLVRRGLALVPEGRRIWGSLSVEDNIRLGALSRRSKQATALEIQRAFERFSVLGEMSHRAAGMLSGGQQQQLAIARALASRPRLLLLDEPSLGLAPAITDSLFDLLGTLRSEGLTILLVEQHTSRAISFCDRGYILRNGRVVLEGSRDDLRDRTQLAEAYLG